MNKKAAAVGSGLLQIISFQNYAIGCAAEEVHIIRIIILQIVLYIFTFVAFTKIRADLFNFQAITKNLSKFDFFKVYFWK